MNDTLFPALTPAIALQRANPASPSPSMVVAVGIFRRVGMALGTMGFFPMSAAAASIFHLGHELKVIRVDAGPVRTIVPTRARCIKAVAAMVHHHAERRLAFQKVMREAVSSVDVEAAIADDQKAGPSPAAIGSARIDVCPESNVGARIAGALDIGTPPSPPTGVVHIAPAMRVVAPFAVGNGTNGRVRLHREASLSGVDGAGC